MQFETREYLNKQKKKLENKRLRGTAIWFGSMGAMRVRSSPKPTKLEKKAAKKASHIRRFYHGCKILDQLQLSI